ncbi:hypothetical protein PybrP1_000304 [[Pythium] brassicae (nom. inval.)]|nr:hypothetical protein PybrP1_000304 [[Pythium] brassicae (nom. inval.)]
MPSGSVALAPPVEQHRMSEHSPLLTHSQRRSYESVTSPSPKLQASDALNVGVDSCSAFDTCEVGSRPPVAPDALPTWFIGLVSASVACTLTWMCGLVILQHTRHWDASAYISVVAAQDLYLYAGVLNSLLGSFLSASGYCCQRFAHNRVKHAPALGVASQQRAFGLGLFLLAIGTLSAVLNLGILGQAVQAPFAALTLIYSALLGHFVLKEGFSLYDLGSSVLIVAGVAVDVYAAQLARVPQPAYTLQSLGALVFRDSVFPLGYTTLALAYTALILRHVRSRQLHARAAGLLAFSSCAGLMAGFTSLATKSAVEVAKSAVRRHTWDVLSPVYALLVLAIPCALVPQLFFLNQGLAYFGTLQFIPLYQAFIILGNTLCGLVFYNEMASYTLASMLCFLAGVAVTLAGVCVLLVKVESQQNQVHHVADANPVTAVRLKTGFTFEQMQWATGDNVTPLRDFDACTRSLVRLLSSASASVYYSTFLCDFTQVLGHSDLDGEPITFLSLLQAAVKRRVAVHILYNPVADYGTESVAALQRLLPQEVHLVCSVSDLGPSCLTRFVSNNSKYAFHHQKYLCVDESVVMVTGCDVNAERAGWLRPNALGYYWHELGVVACCTAPMAAWIKQNHTATRGTRRHYDEFVDAAPFPLVSGGWREENAMVNMILHAEYSVQLENQILVSGGRMQHNRICDALVARIGRAHRARAPFHVLLVTNAAQQDEPSRVTRLYCTLAVQWSLEQLEAGALDSGLSLDELRRYLVVARMESNGVLVKVHSNILIVDGTYALRSSSNLADRSLSARPTDTELGLLFAGDDTVGGFQQELFNMYLSTTGVRYTMADVFARVRAGGAGCCLVPLAKKPWSPVLTWFLMTVFIYGSEGATGGRRKVSYETSVVTLAADDDAPGDTLAVAVVC